MEIRLQKIFSDQGLLSRRAAEQEIKAGHITVNGIRSCLGDKADPTRDRIEWNGQEIICKDERLHKIVIMLYKPAGYVTTMHDEEGRQCVADLLSDIPERLYPVGRLDMYSEGLLLCTNDGELANKLMHPSHEIEKKYLLTLKGSLKETDVQKLTEPTLLDGYELQPVEIRFIGSEMVKNAGIPVTSVVVTLHEGRNREIRRLCEMNGFTVVRLKRVQEGPIQLGKLAPGKWRYLSKQENTLLRKAVNLSDTTENQ